MNRRAPFIDGYHDFVFVGNSRLGEVWRANRLDDGRQVAIKLCTTQPEQFASGHQTIANLAPEKRVYLVQRNPMTEAAIDAGISRDIYVALGDAAGAAATKVPASAWRGS